MSKRLELLALSGPSKGDCFRFDLEEGKSVTIGRNPDCDLVLQDPKVSRKHVQIELRPGGFYMCDVGSSHGTMLMGFQLTPGDMQGRKLGNQDEFKLGDLLLRAVVDESQFEGAKEASVSPSKRAVGGKSGSKGFNTKRIVALLLVVILVLLAGTFLLGPSRKKLPKQLSDVVLNIPQERVLGYWKKGRGKINKDVRHLDKVQFYLPVSDAVIEFETRSEMPIEIKVDANLIDTVEPNPEIWKRHVLVVRDVLRGVERKLIFDNPEFPQEKGKKKRKLGQWGVRNVRVTPLSRGLDITHAEMVAQAAALASRVDKTPEGVYELARAIQRAILTAIIELSIDGANVSIDAEAPLPSPDALEEELRQVEKIALGLSSAAQLEIQLESLTEILGALEAELWRRVQIRINQAIYAAKSKNYIEAHDNLIAVKRMFPDELDYRWVLAEKYFNNKKVVPKKVREEPGRYREKR